MSRFGYPAEPAVTAILAEYQLGPFGRCDAIERGHVNEKWLLETERGRYLLKRRHASLRARALVQAQHALIQHLRRAGFPAPALVLTRSGKTCLVHKGEVYEVQEYVAGDSYQTANVEHLAASARTLGFYHNAVSGFDRDALHRSAERYGPAALARTVEMVVESWRPVPMSAFAQQVRELQLQARDLESRLRKIERLPELVIHGDYHGGNLVFQEHRVVGVVDYDLAHWCWRAMEVAEAVIAFSTDPGLGLEHIVYSGILDLELVGRFVTAYLEEATLSEAEIRALPDMIRTIWICAALDPPLQPPMSEKAAPWALPEVLALASWAQTNASQLVDACLAWQQTPVSQRSG